MAVLFGKSWLRAELLEHVGDIAQIAGLRLAELSDGPGRGVRTATFNTGCGFTFTVLLDRGMDIHDARFRGVPLAYCAPGGIRRPEYFEPEGTGWLRNFHGGWLNTCGLTNVGLPGEDKWGAYGLHGRASNLPATLHGYGGIWHGDAYEIWLEAGIRESRFFGENMQLTRRFSTFLGASHVRITDRIQNLGSRPAPFMLLYHCNFGFPLLAPGSRIILSQKSVHPRDKAAKAGMAGHLVMDAPTQDYEEQVFFHQLHADSAGFATAALVNDNLALAGFVSYRQSELPNFIQWKQMGVGEYVLGLEPANCLVLGRAAEQERGTLQILQPGESRETVLILGAVSGETDVSDLVNRIQKRSPLNS